MTDKKRYNTTNGPLRKGAKMSYTEMIDRCIEEADERQAAIDDAQNDFLTIEEMDDMEDNNG